MGHAEDTNPTSHAVNPAKKGITQGERLRQATHRNNPGAPVIPDSSVVPASASKTANNAVPSDAPDAPTDDTSAKSLPVIQIAVAVAVVYFLVTR